MVAQSKLRERRAQTFCIRSWNTCQLGSMTSTVTKYCRFLTKCIIRWRSPNATTGYAADRCLAALSRTQTLKSDCISLLRWQRGTETLWKVRLKKLTFYCFNLCSLKQTVKPQWQQGAQPLVVHAAPIGLFHPPICLITLSKLLAGACVDLWIYTLVFLMCEQSRTVFSGDHFSGDHFWR